MITAIFVLVLSLSLMVTAVAIVLGGLQIHRLIREHSQKLWVTMLASVYLIPALAILVSARNLRAEVLMEDLAVSGNVFSSLIAKVGYYSLIGLSVALILSRLTGSKDWYKTSGLSRWLLAAMFAYVAGATFGSAIFGSKPTFIPLYLGAPLMFSAVTLLAMQPTVDVLSSLRNVLLILIFSGLATAIALPAVVLETYAIGLIPGFPLRFWGLTTHANTIGPLAALTLLLCIGKPFPSRWLQYAAVTACLFAWLLAHSKTTWLASLVALSVYGVVRNLETPQNNILRWTKLCFVAIAVTIAASLVANGALETVGANTQSKALGGGDFSGRPIIWEVAINEWKKSPLFGYGPSIWSPEYRARIGMNFAFHAHNQFYQTLSESGVIGVILLVLYIFVISVSVVRRNKFRALGVSTLCFVLIRSMSEPTFRVTAAISGDAMIHLVLLCVAITSIRNVSVLHKGEL